MAKMVCTSHQDTITAAIANNTCDVTVFAWPLVDLSKNKIDTKLTSEAPITNKNISVRLESCKLAILRISRGCAHKMVIHSSVIMLSENAIQVIKITEGMDGKCHEHANTIVLTTTEIISL